MTQRDAADWDVLFAWLGAASPVSELAIPLADHECRSCGAIDNHEPGCPGGTEGTPCPK